MLSVNVSLTYLDCLLQNLPLLAGHWTRLRPSLVVMGLPVDNLFVLGLPVDNLIVSGLPADYLIGLGLPVDNLIGNGQQFDWQWFAGRQFMFQSRIFLIRVAFQVNPSN